MPAAAHRSILDPGFRQIQLPIDEGAPGRGGIGQKHPDLAVLDPPGGAGVLPGHPGRLGALLQKPGLVDHQHRRVVTQLLHDVLAQVITHGVGVPGGVIEQPLHRIRGPVPGLLGQRPAVLALRRGQQAAHIHAGPDPRLGTGEPRTDPRQQLLQAHGPVLDLGHGDILGHPNTVAGSLQSARQTHRSRTKYVRLQY
jgi:hypothetical protein